MKFPVIYTDEQGETRLGEAEAPDRAASAQSRDAGRNHGSGDHNGGRNEHRGGDPRQGS